MTGLDIWASILSTGAICTFYTTVVSDTPTPPHCGGWGLHAHCVGETLKPSSTPYFPFLPRKPASQLGPCFLILMRTSQLNGSLLRVQG